MPLESSMHFRFGASGTVSSATADDILLAGAFAAPDAASQPLGVSAWASADAVGTSTVARVDVSVRLYDRGAFSFAYGSVFADAAATAPGGSLAFATAIAGVDVAGADLLLSRSQTTTGGGEADGLAWWHETMEASFLAIDIAALSIGTLSLSKTVTGTYASAPLLADANVASFTADVRVHGPAGYTEVNGTALALSGALSSAVVTATALSGSDGVPDLLRFGWFWSDRIVTGAGDDLVFGGGGNDVLQLGGGNNTGFGNPGADLIQAGAGADWLFGGSGDDTLQAGAGDNWLFGGSGGDRITALGGNDAIAPGQGNDNCDAGDGSNTFLLGDAPEDGDDRLSAGTGADWYVLSGPFGNDVVARFSLAQGDRLVAFQGDWDSDAGLRALNGTEVRLQRASADTRDLAITLLQDGERSTLVLDDFFSINPGFGSVPRGVLTDDQALPLLRAIFVDGDTDPATADRLEAFRIGALFEFLA